MRVLAIAISIPFFLLSAYAVAEVGYLGIPAYHLLSPAGWQVIADLVIAIALICIWMFRDARATGRNPWPYVAASLFLGSFGILAYLLLAPSGQSSPAAEAA